MHVNATPDYPAHVGTLHWPRGLSDLSDTTKCPACFATLSATVCQACKLDLRHPAAQELYDTSLAARAQLSRRVELVGRIRYETASAPRGQLTPSPSTLAPRAAEAPSLPANVAATNNEVAPAPPTIHAAVSPPVVAAREAEPAPPRRSAVQLILLITGISLLAVFAVFFLVYAFINYGLAWRSAIIGLVTIVAFLGASRLRRRRLTASAEAVAVLAMLLVYLDVFALRVNGILSLDRIDGAGYFGLAFLLSALAFIIWHRLGGPRAASIVGYATFAPATGLLLSSATAQFASATSTLIVALGIAAAGLVHSTLTSNDRELLPRFSGTPERIVVVVTVLLALTFASVAALFASSDTLWAPAVGYLLIAGIAAAHAVALARQDAAVTGKGLASVFAVLAGAVSVLVPAAAVWRAASLEHPMPLVMVPAVGASLVAVAWLVAARNGTPRWRSITKAAAFGSSALAALVLLIPAAVTALSTGAQLARALANPLGADTNTSLTVPEMHPVSVLTLLVVTTIAGVAATTMLSLTRRRAIFSTLATTVVALLLLAAPLTTTLLGMLAIWLGAATVSFALLLTARLPQYRPALLLGFTGGVSLAFIGGWMGADTWPVTVAVTIVAAVAARRLTIRPANRATLLAAAAAVLLLGTGVAYSQYSPNALTFGATAGGDPAWPTAVALVAAVVAAIVAAVHAFRASSTHPRVALSSLDRRFLFWLTLVVVTFAAFGSLSAALRNDAATLPIILNLSAALIACIAMVFWSAGPEHAPLHGEHIAATLAAAPALVWLFASAADLTPPSWSLPAIAPISAALVWSLGALALHARRPNMPRWPSDIGIVLVAVPGTLLAPTTTIGWLILVIAAIVVLLLAVSHDGLFGSTSSRRIVGWLALPLATAGLWWRLEDASVTSPEAYLLPLAGVLLGASVLLGRATPMPPHPYRAAGPFVALAGLLVALVPLAVISVSEPTIVRSVIVLATSSALLLAGSVITGHAAARPYLDAAVIAGAVSALLVTFGRGLQAGNDWGWEVEVWLAPSFAALVIAAFAQAALRHDTGEAARRGIADALLITALGVAALLETVATIGEPARAPVATITITALAALHVIAARANRSPLSRRVGWISFDIAAGVAIFTFTTQPHIEFATVPLAVSLIAAGSIRLARTPTARSWPTVGPGVALLLLPSLIATIDDQPLWRLVTLGVVGVSVIIFGVVTRMQAPFVIGTVIVLIHAIATFSPQIRAVYEIADWYVWAGIGGVILTALAIRYEQRIRDFKRAVSTISALR